MIELRSGAIVLEHERFFYGLSHHDEDAFDRPRTSKLPARREPVGMRRRTATASVVRGAGKGAVTLNGLKILAYLSLSDGERSEDEGRVGADLHP